MVFGVSGIGKGVADDVKTDGNDAQHDGRENQLILQRGVHHNHAALVDQVAQAGRRDRQTETDVCDEHFITDGQRDGHGPRAS